MLSDSDFWVTGELSQKLILHDVPGCDRASNHLQQSSANLFHLLLLRCQLSNNPS